MGFTTQQVPKYARGRADKILTEKDLYETTALGRKVYIGGRVVGTEIIKSEFEQSRSELRHPYRFRCTLHTKKWIKYRVNYYAKIFGSAVKMKSKTVSQKKSFLQSVVNLFA